MENIKIYIEYIANIVEFAGVLTILVGIVFALAKFIFYLKQPDKFSFVALRQTLGKSILLGLEILIAADIMGTIATEPTLRSVTVLGLIVFIRTILSLSLQVELEGRFPWQANKATEE